MSNAERIIMGAETYDRMIEREKREKKEKEELKKNAKKKKPEKVSVPPSAAFRKFATTKDTPYTFKLVEEDGDVFLTLVEKK